MKKIAVGNLGEEELAQLVKTRLTREDTRAEADLLFGGAAKDMRKADRGMLEKLFIQTPASVTNAPNLQKTASRKVEMLKLAMSLACGPDGGDNWMTQFEGSPLMAQAIALEEQSLQAEQEDIQSRIEDQTRYSQQDQERNARYQKTDQIRMQKRVLALELAKEKAGLGAQPEEAGPPPEGMQHQDGAVSPDEAAVPIEALEQAVKSPPGAQKTASAAPYSFMMKSAYAYQVVTPELNEGRAARQGSVGGGLGLGATGALVGHHYGGTKGALLGGAAGAVGGAVAGHFAGKHGARATKDKMMSNARERMKMIDQLNAERAAAKAPAVKQASVKTARVFGADAPGFSTESDIPYAVRKKQYEGYAKAKAKEAPTPYKKSVPTGAGIGGIAGGILGAITTKSLKGAALGGAGGAGLGALLGAGATAADKGRISDAKKAIQSSGNMDEALGSHIHKVRRAEAAAKAMNEISREMSKERRHRERMDKGPDEVHHTHTHKTEPKRGSGKCMNCGAPASGGSLCSHCGSNDFSKTSHVDAFFEKLSAPTDAQSRYPELLKVADSGTKKAISLKPRVTTDSNGPTPTRSALSGGSA